MTSLALWCDRHCSSCVLFVRCAGHVVFCVLFVGSFCLPTQCLLSPTMRVAQLSSRYVIDETEQFAANKCDSTSVICFKTVASFCSMQTWNTKE